VGRQAARELVDFKRVMTVIRSFSGVLVLVTATAGSAQTLPSAPDLVTDRPDFTESSEVVGHRVVQIESGLTLEQTDRDTRQVTVPQMLVRVGLGPRFEFRLAGDGFVSETVRTPSGLVRTSGGSDLEIGAKFKFADAGRAGVDLSVIPFLSLPTAPEHFSSNGYDPGFKLTAARDLAHGFGLSGNVNVASVTSEIGRSWERAASVSLGHALTGPFGAYWETFGTLTGGGCDCTVNSGVTMALGGNRQFDVEVGRGISGQAQDWFVGVGFAVRHLH
jgi:hypothetical protein